jgi:glutamate synthase (NADPH/NADH) small chain
MGKPTGFKEYKRKTPKERPIEERIQDYKEIYQEFPDDKVQIQAARCMDCGTPFCHIGCPLGNIIPDWNDLVYNNQWKEAYNRLSSTNNFPEFTGRLCPAPCEDSCVLDINNPPVTIKLIERSIIEHAFDNDWVKLRVPKKRTGKTVAIIGSGPAGLACAQQLNSAGHTVTVFERSQKIGGLLRYGIPDFKMEKLVIDRRLNILEQEGVIFKTGVNVGKNISTKELSKFDALVLCLGASNPNYLNLPGRELKGIHFAMDYLTNQNIICNGETSPKEETRITAEGKDVIVIGGGDTGSDCVGTANRQKAKSVTNFELLPKPPLERPKHQPWPYWPVILRHSSSHEEGSEREWSILTKKFVGEKGYVKKLITGKVEFIPQNNGSRPIMKEIPGTEKEWKADLVILALGFSGNEPDGIYKQLGVNLDKRNNIATDQNYKTNVDGIYAAGDSRRGQSLIVWAISEGREAARHVDKYLMGKTYLPSKGSDVELPQL